MRKWDSNNKELMDKICVEEGENEQGKNCLGLRKVLGINWDIEKDLFVFDFDEIVQLAKDLKFTKRNLLKINATLFDPLGLISPITLQGKLLFKLLCIDKSDWDDELDDIIKQKFLKFLNDLKIIKQISMSRFIYGAFKEHICNIELHCFCDSSLQAYSSVIYIRVITNLDVKVNLICSKTKVSPMKEVTIPQLELMSCALLTKLLQSVLKGLSLNTTSIYCWSDSMIALYWIKNKEWEIWVQNRVDIIKKVVKPDNWHYISSSDNPADSVSRECLPNSIVNNLPYTEKFEFDQRHPASLSSSNYFTKILILYTHDKACQAGAKPTLTELRLRYWIKAQQTIRKITNPCITCNM